MDERIDEKVIKSFQHNYAKLWKGFLISFHLNLFHILFYLIIFLSHFLKTVTQGAILHARADRKFDENYEEHVNVSTTESQYVTVIINYTKRQGPHKWHQSCWPNDICGKLAPEKQQEINISDRYFNWRKWLDLKFLTKLPAFFVLIALAV